MLGRHRRLGARCTAPLTSRGRGPDRSLATSGPRDVAHHPCPDPRAYPKVIQRVGRPGPTPPQGVSVGGYPEPRASGAAYGGLTTSRRLRGQRAVVTAGCGVGTSIDGMQSPYSCLGVEATILEHAEGLAASPPVRYNLGEAIVSLISLVHWGRQLGRTTGERRGSPQYRD